tara:strand:- start:2622 stop:3110 length:489 start_codon:yes stop_codon:yes gene_type:complete
MKFIVFLLIVFFNTNQIIAQDKKRKKKQDIENSLDLDKITFEEAAIKMLELQKFEENIFNPLINQIFKFSSADLILEKDEKEALRQEALKDWYEMQISINRKYYSKKDLIEIIKFYSTDVGKKMNKNIFPIMQEGNSFGQAWGMQFGNKIQKILDQKRKEKN